MNVDYDVASDVLDDCPRSLAPEAEAICVVDGLTVRFPTCDGRMLRAVDGVSLRVPAGQSIGIVGESGSGKSVMALAMLRLLGPAAAVTGSVTMAGIDLLRASPEALVRARGRVAGLILQDPTASLNPIRTIRSQLLESARRLGLAGATAQAEIVDALKSVRLSPDAVLSRYPFQLSGGMNQRVAIAMALIQRPQLLIADEPTTALDVSTQLGILGLLARLQAERHMSLIMISHDLAVVYQLADMIGVMYSGKLVEFGPTDRVVNAPAHPYTRALIAAIPRIDLVRERLETIPGQLRPRLEDDVGCPFRSRCHGAMPRCEDAFPPFVAVAPGHTAACWLTEAAS